VRRLAAAVVAAAVAFGAAAALWSTSVSARRPHVVLVVGCTVRVDQTSLVDEALATTPELLAIARRGRWFSDVVSAAPWTRPATAAALTGRDPLELGLGEPGPNRNDRALDDGALTLAEILKEQGYVTIGRTANPNVAPVFGFDQGFDDYASLSERWIDDVDKVAGSRVVPDALAALDDWVDGDRLYLQVVLVDAHQPYDLHDADAARFLDLGVPPRVARYRAMLGALDRAVAELRAGLESRGFGREDTLFVFTTDHGEGLEWPVHHGRGHGRYLYPSSLRSTWIFDGPGVEPGVSAGLAAQIDLLPTLLDAIDVPAPPGVTGRSRLDGSAAERAFASTLFAETRRAAVYTPSTACVADYGDGTADRTEAERGKPEFVEGCFDRAADPDFAQPSANPELEAALDAWWAPSLASTERQAPTRIDATTRAALRALGYVE
jgi:arylsulfatase A-like enzyme